MYKFQYYTAFAKPDSKFKQLEKVYSAINSVKKFLQFITKLYYNGSVNSLLLSVSSIDDSFSSSSIITSSC